MTKFDSILTDLCEANNYPAPGAQQPASAQNQQPARPVTGNTVAPTTTQQNKPGQTQTQTQNQQQQPQQNKPATTTSANQVKLTPQQTKQLMDDFNGPTQVKSAADFQKYGINLS
jgi:hypothetical protein